MHVDQTPTGRALFTGRQEMHQGAMHTIAAGTDMAYTPEQDAAIRADLARGDSPTAIGKRYETPWGKDREAVRRYASRMRDRISNTSERLSVEVSMHSDDAQHQPHITPCDEPLDAPTQDATPSPDDDTLIRDLGRENAKLKRTVSDLRRRLRIEQASDESYAAIIEAINEQVRPLPHERTFRASSGKKRTRTAVVLISDWHLGEIVAADRVRGINEFDADIATRAAWTLYRKVDHWLADEQNKATVDKVVLAVFGDMATGTIHDELAKTNEHPMPMVQDYGGLMFAEIAWRLAARYPVEIVWVPGNHGRFSHKLEYKLPMESWDYLMGLTAYRRLEHYIKAGDIAWDYGARWFDSFVAQNRLYVVTHGMQVRGQMGIPFYGIKRLVAQLAKQQERIDRRSLDMGERITRVGIDRVIIGHWHTPAVFSECIINGTLKGVDEYSTANAFDPVDRIQIGFLVDPEWGVCGIEPFNLNQPDARHGFALPALPDVAIQEAA